MKRGHHHTVPRKYQPLADYLAALTVDAVTLTFPAIEAIVGVVLPASAYRGALWSNRPTGMLRVQPWVRAGWRVVRTALHTSPPAVTFARVVSDSSDGSSTHR